MDLLGSIVSKNFMCKFHFINVHLYAQNVINGPKLYPPDKVVALFGGIFVNIL